MTTRKLKLKRGDFVKVIAGSCKGQSGMIKKVFVADGKVIVEGVNYAKKHKKRTQNADGKIIPGEIVSEEQKLDISNLVYYDKKQNITSKIGYRLDSEGKKVRYLKKTNNIIVD